MAEYIEREALMEQVKAIHRAVDTSSINLDYDTGFHSATSQIQGLIACLPAADVVEVKRGRWISRYARHWKGKDECSECGFHEKDHRDLSHFNYCPSCGARMVMEDG